jgi:hypothetical protein
MPLASDDLKIGLWIAIHAIRPPEESHAYKEMGDIGIVMMQAQMQPRHPKPWEKYTVDGMPYMVLSINLPFVLVWDGVYDRVANLDMRYVDVMAVTQDYVHAIMQTEREHGYLVPTHLPKDKYAVSNSRQANRTKWQVREKPKQQSKPTVMQYVTSFYPPAQNQMRVEIAHPAPQPPEKDDDEDDEENSSS